MFKLKALYQLSIVARVLIPVAGIFLIKTLQSNLKHKNVTFFKKNCQCLLENIDTILIELCICRCAFCFIALTWFGKEFEKNKMKKEFYFAKLR